MFVHSLTRVWSFLLFLINQIMLHISLSWKLTYEDCCFFFLCFEGLLQMHIVSLKQRKITKCKCHSLYFANPTISTVSIPQGKTMQVSIYCFCSKEYYVKVTRYFCFFPVVQMKRITITDAGEITTSSCLGFRFCENWSLNCLLWSFISAISFWGLIHKLKLHSTSKKGTARKKLLQLLVWIQSFF